MRNRRRPLSNERPPTPKGKSELFAERHIVPLALVLLAVSRVALTFLVKAALLYVLGFIDIALAALALAIAWTVLPAALFLLLLASKARSLIAPVVRHDGFLSVTPRPVGPGSNSNAAADR